MRHFRRMNYIFLQGLIWLYIYCTGLVVESLEPGFLDFDNLPDTNFTCVGKVIGGYYADLETNCQMFHVCTIGQLDEPMDIRFLCLNGTVFDQETRVCERIDEVDCSKSEKFYSLNLELYGNTQPPILEESSENAEDERKRPPKNKPSPTTTTTTTTPAPQTTRRLYYTTSIRPATTINYNKEISTHHFPIKQNHNVRYDPEEINISLNPGTPPNLRTKSFNSFSDSASNKKLSVTTQTYIDEKQVRNDNIHSIRNQDVTTTDRVKSTSYKNIHFPTPHHGNFQVNYHNNYPSGESNYHFQYQTNIRPSGPTGEAYSNDQYHSSTHRNEYLPATRKSFNLHPSSSPRSLYLQPIRSPSHQYFHRTEKPEGDQLPVPQIPTISPILFSSPAPFTLRHVDNKRYTDEHQISPPRIIISASASVSDASGRRLNYSLGTIGAAHIFGQPPSSYDEYSEEDVVLDPFYHDVPKIHKHKRSEKDTKNIGDKEISKENKRKKRSTKESSNFSNVIKSEQEAIDVLKFLFDWYKNQQKTTPKSQITIPVKPEVITEINEQLSANTPPYFEDYEDKHGIQGLDVASSYAKEDYFNDYKDQLNSDKYNANTNRLSNPSQPNTHSLSIKKSDYTDLKETEPDNDENISLITTTTKDDYVDTKVQENDYFQEPLPKNPDYSDTYDYINDNYEPNTYTEVNTIRPEIELKQNLIKDLATEKAVDHLNHHEEETKPFTYTEINTVQPEIKLEENLNQEFLSKKSNESMYHIDPLEEKTEQIAYTEINTVQPEIKPNENLNTELPVHKSIELVDQPNHFQRDRKTYKFLDNNVKTFADLLNSLKSFQRYENQNLEKTTEDDLSVYQLTPITLNLTPSFTLTEEPMFSTTDFTTENNHSIQETATTEVATIPPQTSSTSKTRGRGRIRGRNYLHYSQETQVTEKNQINNDFEHKPRRPSRRRGYSRFQTATEKLGVTIKTPDDIKEVVTKNILSLPNIVITTPVNNFYITKAPNTKEQEHYTETNTEIIQTTYSKEENYHSPEDITDNNLITTEMGVINNKTNLTDTEDNGYHLDSIFESQKTEESYTTETQFQTDTTVYQTTKNDFEKLTDTTEPTPDNITSKNIVPSTSYPLNDNISTLKKLSQTEFLNAMISRIEASTKSLVDQKSLKHEEMVEINNLTSTIKEYTTNTPITTIREPEETTVFDKTSENQTTTTATTILTPKSRSRRPSYQRSRSQKSQNQSRRFSSRHRFSTSVTSPTSDISSSTLSLTTKTEDEVLTTDAPFYKSAHPTQAESSRRNSLSTTPLSMLYKMAIRKEKTKHYVFNCFGKPINKFYSDPRDCRLFHYCTQGYTSSQLLDMKFVCDLGTYFDDEKLICTKEFPQRCK